MYVLRIGQQRAEENFDALNSAVADSTANRTGG
jgi:hypothetical protein